MKRKLSIVAFCTALLLGCQWDPPHDNPLDPASNAYHKPYGTLQVTVKTLIEQPIEEATVLLPELQRFAETNSAGMAQFDEIPVGTWWVVAYRDIEGQAIYTLDSAQVVIDVKASSDISMLLDGLPEITTAFAYSVASSDSSTQRDPNYSIRLKSTVFDPDGVHHLERVEAEFIDTLHNYRFDVRLQYNADSAFWWYEIPADSFLNNSTDNALFIPFTFLAYDFANKTSPPGTAFVARVIRDVPVLDVPATDTIPRLSWGFRWYDEFRDTSAFNYHVIIYRDIPPLREIHRKVIIPRVIPSSSYTLEERLPNGIYYWEVLVLDNFGNSSRSPRSTLIVGIESS